MIKYPILVNLLSYFYPYKLEERKGEITSYLEVVIDKGNVLLNSEKVNYSFGSLHEIYFRTFKKLVVHDRKIEKTLVLGFGAGSIAALLTETFHKDCSMVGIEADAVVIELAEKYFDTGRFSKLKIHHADAYNFVLSCAEKFDLIVIDLFIEDETPVPFSSHEFLSAIGNILSPSGLVCYNRIVSDQRLQNDAENLVESFDSVIGPTYIIGYQMLDTKNWMIVYDRTALVITQDFKNISSETFI